MMNEYQDPIISRIEFDKQAVLEIGCGYGSFTLEHLLHAKSILGLDTNDQAIAWLKEQRAKFQEDGPFIFVAGSILDYPLQERGFDIAVFSNSF
jgi:ubiquinone/menaquinone biosynthesis C-methylase UbiE